MVKDIQANMNRIIKIDKLKAKISNLTIKLPAIEIVVSNPWQITEDAFECKFKNRLKDPVSSSSEIWFRSSNNSSALGVSIKGTDPSPVDDI